LFPLAGTLIGRGTKVRVIPGLYETMLGFVFQTTKETPATLSLLRVGSKLEAAADITKAQNACQ